MLANDGKYPSRSTLLRLPIVMPQHLDLLPEPGPRTITMNKHTELLSYETLSSIELIQNDPYLTARGNVVMGRMFFKTSLADEFLLRLGMMRGGVVDAG